MNLKRLKITIAEETPYACFKRGWLLGASGSAASSVYSSPEPKYIKAYDEGYQLGHEAFATAMRKVFSKEMS